MNIDDLPLGRGLTAKFVRLAHAPRLTAHADLAVALRDLEYLKSMIQFADRKSNPKYPLTPRHALATAVERGLIDWDRHTLEDVRRIVVHVADHSSVVDTRENKGLKILPTLLVFAQSQGLVPCHGWSEEDLARANEFRLALQAEGLSGPCLERDFRYAVQYSIWARLHVVRPGVPSDSDIGRFALFDCYFSRQSKDMNRAYVARQTGLRRWRRYLNGQTILTENGDVRRENCESKKPLQPSIAAFRMYLLDDLGLLPATVSSYINDICRWHHRLGEDASLYSPKLLRQVCQEEFDRRSPTGQTRFLSVLRRYIKFRARRDECDRTLLNAIISRPSYSQGTVPKTKPFETLRGYIAACDANTPVGLRARAVMSLLLETGIRAKEAGHLKLEDIDWEKGEFVIDAKGRRREVMPLPHNAGHAILDWIEKGRPKCDCPYVFIRLHRPFQALNLDRGISTLVGEELEKQGVGQSGAAHVFRHSFARQHLKRGLTLPQIGRLLRHRTVETTQIYAKVDDKMLAQVAQDWPGEVG